MAKRDIIVELGFEVTDAITDLGKLEASLIEVRKETTALKKEIREQGGATTEQAQRLGQLNSAAKRLSSDIRELSNDTSGLTAQGMRFRDKMAQATLEAIKQSGILGQLQAKSETLNLKIVNLTKSYKEGDITVTQYNQQLNILQQELNQTTVQMTAMDKKVDQLTLDFKEGRITADQFKAGVASINAEVRAQTTAFQQGVKDLKSYALGFVGVVAAAQAVIGVFSDAARTVADFDKALSSIRALGGEYAARINDIAEVAKTAGINFGFTATETLGAVEALAKAGVTTADILGGSLQGALTLAAAGQLSVADAAETASKAMTQFGLAGQDIPHLADLLAAGAASATGEVTDFAQALNQSGLVASQAGISIEETVGTLTAFASAGLLGSDAGTSFRTMLLRLQNPSKESAAQMKALGLNAFDAQGGFVGLEALAGQLQERLSGLTEEQRSAALAQIFGTDAVRAANVLYVQGAEGIAKYREQVEQAGFAQRVAGEQTQNLRGALDRAGAAYDAFILSIEDGSGPIGRATAAIVNMFSTIFEGFAMLERRATALRDLRGEFDEFAEATSQTLDEALIEQELNRIRIQQIADARQQQDEFQIDLFENRRSRLEAQVRDLERQQGSLAPAQLVGLFALKVELKGLNAEIESRKASLEEQNKVQAVANAVTEGAANAANSNAEATKKEAEAVRILTDDLRAFLEIQKQLEEGQGVGRMQARGAAANAAENGGTSLTPVEFRLLGPSPAQVQAAKDLTDTDTETFVTAQEAKIAALDALGNAIGGIAQLMGDQTRAGKAFATAQALINTYLGVTQILANKTVLPEPAGTIQKTAAIAGTLATGLAAVRRIQGFEEGGYTSKKASNHTEVGVVHANEWVAPAWMTKSSAYAPIIQQLEEARKMRGMTFGPDGFFVGGRASTRGTALVNTPTAPSVPGGVIMGADLARAIRGLNINPIVRVTDIIDVMGSVARVSQASAI